jgi:hypothetical protein
MNSYIEIKKALQHVYFINGTAFAGKSSVCKALAKKHDMILCEENYNFDEWLKQTTPKSHPYMNYFKTMGSWEEFVTRSKEDYDKWIEGVSLETAPFEIETLLSLPKDKRIIVDTNIPHHILKEISDDHHVCYMVTSTEISMNEFFNREDKEKNFLLEVIKNSDNPEENLKHYKDTIAYINREEKINVFRHSGFFCIERKSLDESIDDKINLVEKHFNL